MAIALPADRRFRRAHVSPSRRRGLRRWGPLAARTGICVALMYAVMYAGALALSADALTVSHLTVEGNTRMSRGEVLALLEDARGTSMVTADLEGWRARLLRLPWVEDATIRRVLPGTVTVSITEREPMGIARIDTRLLLIDRDGVIIEEFGPNYADLDLPIIDGLAAVSKTGTLIDAPRAALAGRLLADVERRPAIARLISQIDVSDPRNAAVILNGDTATIRVGRDRFAERIQAYLGLRAALRERVPDIDYVDLRFDERVYVRPQGGRRGS